MSTTTDLCALADRRGIPTPSGNGYMPTWLGTVAWMSPDDDHNWRGLRRDVIRALANQ